MKQFAVILIMLVTGSVTAQAQNSSHKGKHTTTKTHSTKAPATDTLDQSKNYNWKDGQQATPSGHEATGTNGSASPMPKDSTAVADTTRRSH